jgi:hypothetical protein
VREPSRDHPSACGGSGASALSIVDPRYFHGTIYRAANWEYVDTTRGFRRTRGGYSSAVSAPKLIFVRPLVSRVQARLAAPVLDPAYHHGAPKLMLRAQQMRSLPAFFADIPDPRRTQGRRHPPPVVLAIAAAAVLCGARGYKAISAWAQDLGQKARARFRCRYRNGRYEVPSRTIFRDVLTRVQPGFLDQALQGWNAQYASEDEGLAIDGKTMCNAIDEQGRQTCLSSAHSDMNPKPATPKKSRRSAPKGRRGGQADQRDRDVHSPARGNLTSPARRSPPTPYLPSARLPATWSKNGARTICSSPKTTSPPCWRISACSSKTALSRTFASRWNCSTDAWNRAPSGPPPH